MENEGFYLWRKIDVTKHHIQIFQEVQHQNTGIPAKFDYIASFDLHKQAKSLQDRKQELSAYREIGSMISIGLV